MPATKKQAPAARKPAQKKPTQATQKPELPEGLKEIQDQLQEIQTEIEVMRQEDQILKEHRVQLLKKMHRVMEKTPYIQKDKQNEHHKYWYASEEAIKKHLQIAFAEQKMMLLLPEATKIEKAGNITTIRLHYEFVDVETGYSIPGSIEGEGQDTQDKGVYKAITGAIKYALTGNFLIPTGEDPEREPKEKPKTEKTPAKGKTSPTQPAQEKTTSRPMLTKKQFNDMKAAIANAVDDKRLKLIEAKMAGYRMKNIEKFDLEKAITMKRSTLSALPPEN